MSSAAVSIDYNTAKVQLHVLEGNHPHGGVVEAEAQLEPRQARKIAINLLQSADEAEAQRAQNLKRTRFAMKQGDTDLAAQLAEMNGFTEDELNGKD